LPPLAAAIAWLVLSHHRLPLTDTEPITANQLGTGLQDLIHNWNQPCGSVSRIRRHAVLAVSHGLPCNDSTWCARVAKLAGQLAARPSGTIWLDEVYPLHLARLSLMLADHHFSSQTVKQSWQSAQEKDCLCQHPAPRPCLASRGRPPLQPDPAGTPDRRCPPCLACCGSIT
jgi:CRISPR-associated endonuclease/helicase Cas3